MKTKSLLKWMLAGAVLACAMPATAQWVSSNNDDEVYKVDQRASKAYRPGQVIVKFKDNSRVKVRSNAKGKFQSAGVSDIDKVLTGMGITEADQLMPLTGAVKGRAPRRAKALSGRTVIEPDLSLLYCFKFEQEGLTVEEAVENLKSLDEVEYAEPNYLAFIQSTGTEDLLSYISEPMYSQQWGLNAIKLPQLWAMDKVETERPVIAILDTGVDINHPDLKDNIWTNANEAGGADYEDDDNNGYVDDVHGWDFVAGTPIIGNGMDRNGHGTHCAGIAAAVGNNNLGIVGANPDAYILPIKVMGDDGTGDIATICRGIDYAVACKAHVLSMSFGGGSSAAAYQALTKALTNYAVLCAAAGNDGTDIYDILEPTFPGAYDIVLGVMASGSDGQLAGFSNYDPDGPFFSRYNMDKAFSTDVTWNDELMWNYDVMAPGVSIMSTYLNGSYKSLNGTSMATPMVAGAISRILQVKGYDYARDYGLMGDMAMAKDGSYLDLAVFDARKAASFDETNREVALALIALEIDDSEGDGDGRFDAGEVVNIWPTVRSLWGHAENIKIGIEPYDENTPTDAIEVLDNNVDFGWSLNSRGSFKSQNPIRVKVNENAWDGMHLPYKIVITSDNLLAGIEQEHVFEIENGVEIKGLISEDMTLYPDKHYVVTQNIAIPEGVTLTIKPGTVLKFRDNTGLSNAGTFIAKGTPDSMIVFTSSNEERAYVKLENLGIEYAIIENLLVDGYGYSFADFSVTNCISRYNEMASYYAGYWENCNIYGNMNGTGYIACTEACNIVSNMLALYSQFTLFPMCDFDDKGGNIFNNYMSDGRIANLGYNSSSPIILTTSTPSYYGSAKESTVRQSVFDIESGYGFAKFDLSNMLTRPAREAHGIVWKVVVDGYDAQDEFDLLPPLGVGSHKFEVYYNRDDMDTTFTPSVSMGFREPYTQTPIAEGGYWTVKDSASVYTVFLDITGKTNCDGLNRIKVTGGKDYDHFDIPDEYWRFNVLVQAAGSMATGFAAEAGLGKVDLTWNNEHNDFEDAMGFNVYRYTEEEKLMPVYDEWGNEVWDYDEDGNWVRKEEMQTVRDTIRLNEMILDLDTDNFTDYEVTPGETYYYYYKVLSTDLKEYDISNVVAATPLTSTLGDANASGNVDVADVITTVNYAAGMEPRPFIFGAADVNADETIDILDVIGIIKIITRPDDAATASVEAVAEYSVEDGVVYVDCPVDLAGVQLTLTADRDDQIAATADLRGFEQVGARLAEDSYLFLAYNLAGRTLGAGRHAILTIGAGEVADIRLSDKDGHNILAVPAVPTLIDHIAADRPVRRGVYDLMGRKVAADASALPRLQPGIYIVNGNKVAVK